MLIAAYFKSISRIKYSALYTKYRLMKKLKVEAERWFWVAFTYTVNFTLPTLYGSLREYMTHER